MDSKNNLVQHSIVFCFSGILFSIQYYFLKSELTVSFARTSYFLLFALLCIGPLTKIVKTPSISSKLFLPLNWRGELGIWFAIVSLAHFIVLLTERPLTQMIRIGGSGYSLSNLLGLIALIYAIILAITSFGKIIIFLGGQSWKWLHGFAYVIFYLVSAHVMYFQFFSTRSTPDWFGYSVLSMSASVIILQKMTFLLLVRKQRKTGQPTTAS